MQRLRALHLLIQCVVWSFVVAFVVGLATLPGTPRYRRTRHAERRQGKALYIVRLPPRTNDKPATPFPLRPSRTKADSRLGPLHRTPAYPRTNDKTATPMPVPTRRPRTDHAQAWLYARVFATQGFKLMMGASLLISFTGPKSPLFDIAHAAGTPCTTPHPHTHADTRTYARLRASKCAARTPLECGKPIARGHARTRTHPPEMLPPSLSASCASPPLPATQADLWPLFVADVGHAELFCEEFCAGADVHAEMHSRAVLGQAVRGTMSTRGRMRNTRSTVTGVPMGYS